MATPPAEGASPPLALLAVRAGARAGDLLPIRSPVVSIGRGSQNDIVLDDDSVSSTHARLEYETGAWRITDLGSANGTYVEGIRLAPDVPTPITYGSSVRFGALQLHFRAVPDADPASARAAYVPPPAPARPARRTRAFRLPLWVLALLVVVLVAAIVFVAQLWTEPGPERPPEPVTASLHLPSPAGPA